MTQGFMLDKATILERLGGDEEIFDIMADMYLEDVDNYCSNLRAAFVAGNLPELHREAHTIKGLLATFADETGASLAASLEQRAKLGEAVSGLAAAVNEVEGRLCLVAEAIRQGKA